MTSPLASALSGATPVRLIPCRVRTVTPMVIDFHDDTPIDAVKISGSYATGEALALLPESAQPVVLPNGA